MLPKLLFATLILLLGINFSASASTVVDSKKFVIYFRHDKTDIDLTYRNNATNVRKIKEFLKHGHQIDSINIVSSASLDGVYEHNEKISRLRAASMKQLIAKSVDKQLARNIHVYSKGEDWEGFRAFIVKHYYGPDRWRILNILNSSVRNDTKKWRLQQLSGGKTYKELIYNYAYRWRTANSIVVYCSHAEGDVVEQVAVEVVPAAEGQESVVAEKGKEDVVDVDKEIEKVTEEVREMVAKKEKGEEKMSVPEGDEKESVVTEKEKKGKDDEIEKVAEEDDSVKEQSEEIEEREQNKENKEKVEEEDEDEVGEQSDSEPAAEAEQEQVGEGAIEQEQDSEQVAEVPPEKELRKLFAVKTNVLYDLASLINYSVEMPIGNRFSALVQSYNPWWTSSNNQICNQMFTLGAEARYWFGRGNSSGRVTRGARKSNPEPLMGHSIGLYGLSGKGDWRYEQMLCYQAYFVSAGLSYNYSFPLGKNLNMEFSFAAGWARIQYNHYIPSEDYSILFRDYSNHGTFDYFGPTKIEISLVLPIRAYIGGRKK